MDLEAELKRQALQRLLTEQLQSYKNYSGDDEDSLFLRQLTEAYDNASDDDEGMAGHPLRETFIDFLMENPSSAALIDKENLAKVMGNSVLELRNLLGPGTKAGEFFRLLYNGIEEKQEAVENALEQQKENVEQLTEQLQKSNDEQIQKLQAANEQFSQTASELDKYSRLLKDLKDNTGTDMVGGVDAQAGASGDGGEGAGIMSQINPSLSAPSLDTTGTPPAPAAEPGAAVPVEPGTPPAEPGTPPAPAEPGTAVPVGESEMYKMPPDMMSALGRSY